MIHKVPIYHKIEQTCSILIISIVLSQSGGGEGDAIFLNIKCHALCSICLTFFVVHFSTLIILFYFIIIYVSILKSMKCPLQ